MYIEFHGFLDSWNTILVCPKKGRLTCGLNSWTTVVTAMENLADLYYYAKKINMPDATLLSCLPFKHNVRLELYFIFYTTKNDSKSQTSNNETSDMPTFLYVPKKC